VTEFTTIPSAVWLGAPDSADQSLATLLFQKQKKGERDDLWKRGCTHIICCNIK